MKLFNNNIATVALLAASTIFSAPAQAQSNVSVVRTVHTETINGCLPGYNGVFYTTAMEVYDRTYSDGTHQRIVMRGQATNQRCGSSAAAVQQPTKPTPVYYYPSLESQLALGKGTERVACQNGVPYVISADGKITSYPAQRCRIGDRSRNQELASN